MGDNRMGYDMRCDPAAALCQDQVRDASMSTASDIVEGEGASIGDRNLIIVPIVIGQVL